MSVCMYVDICTLVSDTVVNIGLWGQASSLGSVGGGGCLVATVPSEIVDFKRFTKQCVPWFYNNCLCWK